MELLVAVAIIAILAALLLPALSRVKNQSAKATDFNNLHQTMVAVQIYTQNNKDGLPWSNWDYGAAMPDDMARPGWLYTPDLKATGAAVFKAQRGQLWDELHQAKLYLCPMDRPDMVYATKGATKQRAQQLSSYIMNGAVNGFRSGYYSNALPVKISAMKPEDCILFEADDRKAGSFNDGASWPNEGVTARHQQGATLTAADGSAEYVRDAEWAMEASDTNRNRLWCYPATSDGGDPVYGHDRW